MLENPVILFGVVVVALIGGYLAIKLLFFVLKRLLGALGQTASFVLGFAIVTLLDLKFIALATVTLSQTATYVGPHWNLFAVIMGHYLIAISLIYLPISLMARDRSKQLEANSQMPQNVSAFFASFGISSGFIGIIGLILGFSLTFYTLDLSGKDAFGAVFPIEHYFSYSFQKLLESMSAAELWANLFNEGEPVSKRYLESENIWAQLLNLGYVTVIRVWLIGLVLFTLMRVFRSN